MPLSSSAIIEHTYLPWLIFFRDLSMRRVCIGKSVSYRRDSRSEPEMASIFENANSFLPRSFSEAPMW